MTTEREEAVERSGRNENDAALCVVAARALWRNCAPLAKRPIDQHPQLREVLAVRCGSPVLVDAQLFATRFAGARLTELERRAEQHERKEHHRPRRRRCGQIARSQLRLWSPLGKRTRLVAVAVQRPDGGAID